MEIKEESTKYSVIGFKTFHTDEMFKKWQISKGQEIQIVNIIPIVLNANCESRGGSPSDLNIGTRIGAFVTYRCAA